MLKLSPAKLFNSIVVSIVLTPILIQIFLPGKVFCIGCYGNPIIPLIMFFIPTFVVIYFLFSYIFDRKKGTPAS